MRIDSVALEVWRVSLEVGEEELAALAGDLSDAEAARASRLRSAAHRRRHVVAHAALRRLLGAKLGMRARDVPIDVAAGGKPVLGIPASHLRFNLSHSGEVALVAITAGREVGVDVEQLRGLARLDELSRKVLAPCELAELAALEQPARAAAFLTAWTRKEAVLKALGDGLSRDPATVEVSFAPGAAAALLALGDASPAAWHLEDVDAGPGYVAAIAYSGSRADPVLRTCTPAAAMPAATAPTCGSCRIV